MFNVYTEIEPQPITFPDDASWEIDERGLLWVSIGSTDVAVFADGGWTAVTRPVPEPEAPYSDDSDDEDYEDGI